MAPRLSASALPLLLSLAAAQQIGPYTPEVHPQLTTYECTVAGGCTAQNTSVVIDANYRWVHEVGGYNSCTDSAGLNATICPSVAACGKACALEGVTYASSGVSTNGSSINLKQFVGGSGVSPRLYLLGSDGDYVGLKLLGREISFTADVSQLPCGMNGALYLSNMPLDGGRNNATNPAGANYGTGYCDAQCPKANFINGTVRAALSLHFLSSLQTVIDASLSHKVSPSHLSITITPSSLHLPTLW
jgi:cellulase